MSKLEIGFWIAYGGTGSGNGILGGSGPSGPTYPTPPGPIMIGTGTTVVPPLESVSANGVVTVTGAVIVARSGKRVCEKVSDDPEIVATKKGGRTRAVVLDGLALVDGSPPATALTVTVEVDTPPVESVKGSRMAVNEDPSALVIVVS